MICTEKHIIDIYNPNFKEMDNLCFLAKNLYNRANYIVRQAFIETSKLKEAKVCEHAIYLDYYDIRRILVKDDVDYKALPAKVSNQILKKLDKNWKSFFASIKDWKKFPNKYTGRPSLPNYKDKVSGRFILEYELGAISKVALQKEGKIKLSKTNISIPFINKDKKLKQARIIPINKVEYKIEILYVKEEKEKVNFLEDFQIGIDLGVNNLVTITSNKKRLNPIIVNGRPIKSINQYYNKTKAKLMSELPNEPKKKEEKKSKEIKEKDKKEAKLKQLKTSKKIDFLTNKRNAKIEKYFHQTSNLIIEHCLYNKIKTICIGKNQFWKQNTNMSKKNNQNFVSIPFAKLISQIEYKAKLNGLSIIFTEESYTSKASFLNMDKIPTYNQKNSEDKYEFSGYRQHRGLYKIKGEKITINADVNGSFNIIRKAVPNAFADGIEGIAVCPIKVTFDK